MAILVTGATGLLGRHLTDRLLRDGRSVRIITRDPGRVPSSWSGRVEVITGDLRDRNVLKAATKGVDLLFHLAGETQNAALMRAVNVEAVRGLLEASALAGVKRMVHTSSVGVIGAEGPGIITEDSPCRPKNEYEQTKLEGERAVLAFAHAAGFDAVVVRPTIVFGEGVIRSRDSLIEWMRAVRRGRFAFIGNKAVANYVYAGDVAEAMVRLGERPSPGGAVYHVADPAPMRDFVETMAAELGVPCPTRTIPAWAAYVAAATLEAAGSVVGMPVPLTRSRVRTLSSTCLFSAEKLRVQAGVTLPHGYREGVRRTVRWYREKGRL